MPEWTVQHRRHDGTIIQTYRPAGNITINRNRNAPSSVNYQLARSDPLLKRDAFAPYATDFHIFRDTVRIASGPITEVAWDANDEGAITVVGQTWLHLLEKRVAPVDLLDRSTWIAYDGVPITTLVQDVIDAINNLGLSPGLIWVLDSTVNGVNGFINTTVQDQLAALDGQYILDFIRKIGDRDDGYDFEGYWFGADSGGVDGYARLVLYHPKRDRGVRWTFTKEQFIDQRGFVDLRWTNIGPANTVIYALGQGLGGTPGVGTTSNRIPYEKETASATTKYRRLEEQIDFATVRDELMLQKMADARARIDHRENYKVELGFSTQAFPNINFWTYFDPGDRFKIDYDFDFHRINEEYIMNSYSATITENGDEWIVPELERVPS
jgi:hypothetical protein